MSKNYASPFAINARAAGRNYPDQGKSDDIAVIVAQIFTKGQGPGEQQALDTNGTGLNKDSDTASTSGSSTKDDL